MYSDADLIAAAAGRLAEGYSVDWVIGAARSLGLPEDQIARVVSAVAPPVIDEPIIIEAPPMWVYEPPVIVESAPVPTYSDEFLIAVARQRLLEGYTPDQLLGIAQAEFGVGSDQGVRVLQVAQAQVAQIRMDEAAQAAAQREAERLAREAADLALANRLAQEAAAAAAQAAMIAAQEAARRAAAEAAAREAAAREAAERETARLAQEAATREAARLAQETERLAREAAEREAALAATRQAEALAAAAALAAQAVELAQPIVESPMIDPNAPLPQNPANLATLLQAGIDFTKAQNFLLTYGANVYSIDQAIGIMNGVQAAPIVGTDGFTNEQSVTVITVPAPATYSDADLIAAARGRADEGYSLIEILAMGQLADIPDAQIARVIQSLQNAGYFPDQEPGGLVVPSNQNQAVTVISNATREPYAGFHFDDLVQSTKENWNAGKLALMDAGLALGLTVTEMEQVIAATQSAMAAQGAAALQPPATPTPSAFPINPPTTTEPTMATASRKPFSGYAFSDLVNAAKQRLAEGYTAEQIKDAGKSLQLTDSEITSILANALPGTQQAAAAPNLLPVLIAGALFFLQG